MSAYHQLMLAVGSLAGSTDFYVPPTLIIFNLIGAYSVPSYMTFNL